MQAEFCEKYFIHIVSSKPERERDVFLIGFPLNRSTGPGGHLAAGECRGGDSVEPRQDRSWRPGLGQPLGTAVGRGGQGRECVYLLHR